MRTLPHVTALLLAGCVSLPPNHLDASLRTVDESQRRMVAAGDAAGLEQLAHPGLQINAPTGRVLGREQFLSMMRGGQIKAEQFDRVAETVTVTGRNGVVMGRETFTPPTAASDLGRTYGVVPLQRRYTNVYLLEDGRWRWLARHANVAPRL